MPDIDLSDYAGLFVFGIIAVCATLSYLNYKAEGASGVGITALLSIVGAWVSIGIVNLADFDDATPETVITICVGTLILPLIYSIVIIRRWIARRKIQRAKNKIQVLQEKLKNIEKKLDYERTVMNLLHLLKKCEMDVSCFEGHPKLASQKILIDEATKIGEEIRTLSLQMQLGGQVK